MNYWLPVKKPNILPWDSFAPPLAGIIAILLQGPSLTFDMLGNKVSNLAAAQEA